MMNMNMMNDPALAGMIPFDPMQFYEPPKPRYIFKMPRVVPNQKDKFESDDLFKRLHRDGEVRYTGFRDRPQDERQLRFQTGCREGHTELSFVASGTNVQLIFNPGYHHHHHPAYAIERECDFDKEIGKVHIKSHFILNGVCVRFRGWVDLERLDGIGRLEYDERRGAHEDSVLKEQLERYSQRLKDFEDTKRGVYPRPDDVKRDGQTQQMNGWRR